MPNYLLLLHENPAVFEEMSPEEMQAIITKYSAWKEELAQTGLMLSGKKLQDGVGRVLRRHGGQHTISDGPYTESKEVIGGLFEIVADSYEQAVEIALQCPHLEYGTVEVRQIELG